jgi:hypothetical protein
MHSIAPLVVGSTPFAPKKGDQMRDQSKSQSEAKALSFFFAIESRLMAARFKGCPNPTKAEPLK